MTEDTPEERAAAFELRLLQLEVAEARGLTLKQARRLRGSTAEEMLVDADDLMAAFGMTEPTRPPGGKPTENLSAPPPLPLNGDPIIQRLNGLLQPDPLSVQISQAEPGAAARNTPNPDDN